MNEHRFTPGNWSVINSGGYISIISAEQRLVPVVSWPGFDDSDRPLAEHLANADLIAAAPRMFAALVALVERYDNVEWTYEDAYNTFLKKSAPADWARAKSAISLALGHPSSEPPKGDEVAL